MKHLLILLFLLIPAMSKESEFSYRWQTAQINNIVEREAQKHNIDPKIVYRLIDAESSGRPKVKHPLIKIRVKGQLIKTRAVGLMGIIRQYHYKGTQEQLETPAENIKTGCIVLANCRKRAKGDLIVALKNYNSGYYSNYYNWKYINKILKGIK